MPDLDPPPVPSHLEIPFSTVGYERRLLVLIDILGFKEYVRNNRSLNEEQGVISLVSYFRDKVSEGVMKLFGVGGRMIIPTFNFFSDTILISLPFEVFNSPDEFKVLKTDSSPSGAIDLDKWRLLQFVSSQVKDVQLHALKHGLLTRGCITVGDVYHNKSAWFGPALIEAHEHESQLAIFPRVILSNTAFECFKDEVLADQNGLWFQDADGFYHSNYLGWIHAKLHDDFCSAHHILREIIVRNMLELREAGKVRALQKWKWLALFFNKYSDGKLRAAHGDKLAPNIDI